MTKISMEDMATFCKRKGFVYQNSEIYGSMAGFFDYGPLGAEMKNNLKQAWWKYYVRSREDVVGIDGTIVTNPKVWQASGHVDCFDDVMVECTKCHDRIRGDHLIEEQLKIQADGLGEEDINKLIKENNIKCKTCGAEYGEAAKFNLMFQTFVGPKQEQESVAYLRPETAQLMFTNFRLVQENARLKLPFGIAQIGRAFRNEISPRHFLFRCREFEQMEIEYFINPKDTDNCPYLREVENEKITIFSAEMQEKNEEPKKVKVKDAVKKKVFKTPWHAYWLADVINWFGSLGANKDNFRCRQHLADEKSHYALDTWDLEYNFPFGWKELQGLANRTDFDLKAHMKLSKKDLSIFDDETKEKVVPHVVAEPSLGVDRAFLVFMFDAYTHDKQRDNVVLKLHPKLAPYQVAVFPLVKKLNQKARDIFGTLKEDFVCFYDVSGSIGRRYSRQDEIGTPICITIDFDTLEDNKVTIRDRDTTKQVRVEIKKLKDTVSKIVEKNDFSMFNR